MIEKIFGQVLCKFRNECGFSQEQLGFESGYHRTYISLLERGFKNPSIKTIFQLAKALKVKPSEIIQQMEVQLNNIK